MAWKVDERIPEDLFIKLMTEKANIIKDHLKNSLNQLIIVANIGPTMAIFKFYDLKEEDSLKLCITLSNLGDIDEQIHQLVAASELFAAAILFPMSKSLFR